MEPIRRQSEVSARCLAEKAFPSLPFRCDMPSYPPFEMKRASSRAGLNASRRQSSTSLQAGSGQANHGQLGPSLARSLVPFISRPRSLGLLAAAAAAVFANLAGPCLPPRCRCVCPFGMTGERFISTLP